MRVSIWDFKYAMELSGQLNQLCRNHQTGCLSRAKSFMGATHSIPLMGQAEG